MGKLILITGGARSGKSSHAESLAKRLGGNILYVATSIPFDEEMKLRVKKHREQRPPEWETIEAYKDLDQVLPLHDAGKSGILLDCITIMVTNIMYETKLDWDNLSVEAAEQMETKVMLQIDKLLSYINSSNITLIAVTNETGMGIVPDNAMARAFRDTAGRVNQKLAKSADEVYFCVSGIPVKIKQQKG